MNTEDYLLIKIQWLDRSCIYCSIRVWLSDTSGSTEVSCNHTTKHTEEGRQQERKTPERDPPLLIIISCHPLPPSPPHFPSIHPDRCGKLSEGSPGELVKNNRASTEGTAGERDKQKEGKEGQGRRGDETVAEREGGREDNKSRRADKWVKHSRRGQWDHQQPSARVTGP